MMPPTQKVKVVIHEKDLVRQVFRSGGPGGQNQNKVSSGVRYIHVPTGVTGEARDTRSQHENAALARERLVERLEALAAIRLGLGVRAAKKPATFAHWDREYRLVGSGRYVRDRRTGHEDPSPGRVLDGGIGGFIAAGLADAASQAVEVDP